MIIAAFDNILLGDTFVLSWSQTADSLTFNVLASLLQSHPDASPPLPGDWACYRSAQIRFSGVSSIDGLLPQQSVHATRDPDDSQDYGCIERLSLVRPGEYRICGEFGEVTVVASNVSLVLEAEV